MAGKKAAAAALVAEEAAGVVAPADSKARVVESDGRFTVEVDGGCASSITDLINAELNAELRDEKGKVVSPLGHSVFLDSLTF